MTYILPCTNQFALCPSGKLISSRLKGLWGNPNHHHPRQMPNGSHHDAEVEGKLVGTALLEEYLTEKTVEHFASLYTLPYLRPHYIPRKPFLLRKISERLPVSCPGLAIDRRVYELRPITLLKQQVTLFANPLKKQVIFNRRLLHLLKRVLSD